jgi:hypothetical protein
MNTHPTDRRRRFLTLVLEDEDAVEKTARLYQVSGRKPGVSEVKMRGKLGVNEVQMRCK